MSTKKLSVGGQAVIEGVMMRGPHKVAVAVRQPDGEIAVDVNPVNSIRDKYPILKNRCFAALLLYLNHYMTVSRPWPIRHRFQAKRTSS